MPRRISSPRPFRISASRSMRSCRMARGSVRVSRVMPLSAEPAEYRDSGREKRQRFARRLSHDVDEHGSGSAVRVVAIPVERAFAVGFDDEVQTASVGQAPAKVTRVRRLAKARPVRGLGEQTVDVDTAQRDMLARRHVEDVMFEGRQMHGDAVASPDARTTGAISFYT